MKSYKLLYIAIILIIANVIVMNLPSPQPLTNKHGIVYVEVMNETKIEPFIYPREEINSSQEAMEMLELSMLREETLINLESIGGNDQNVRNLVANSLPRIQRDIIYYEEQYNLFIEQEAWDVRREEYPVATIIWLYLKEQGFNDYVAAGIMGNMMTEAGGGLNINTSASNGEYYGICQWGSGYPGRYTDLDGQLELLMSTIEYEFSNFSSYGYEGFLNIQDEREAAMAFARAYERCASFSYSSREYNASIALNYFTS